MFAPLLIGALACGRSSSFPPTDDDTAAVNTDTTERPIPEHCDEAFDVTYENWGRGFLTTQCSGCHAETAPDRYDAPPEAIFDTVEQTDAWADRIIERVIYDSDMPPAGGVTDDEKTLLSYWLECP